MKFDYNFHTVYDSVFHFRPKKKKFRLFILDMGLGAETHAKYNSFLRYAKKMHAQKLFPVKTVSDSIF